MLCPATITIVFFGSQAFSSEKKHLLLRHQFQLFLAPPAPPTRHHPAQEAAAGRRTWLSIHCSCTAAAPPSSGEAHPATVKPLLQLVIDGARLCSHYRGNRPFAYNQPITDINALFRSSAHVEIRITFEWQSEYFRSRTQGRLLPLD